MSSSPPIQRFMSHVAIPQDTSQCWPWDGNTDEHGNGIFHFHGRDMRAARWIYQFYVGTPPGSSWVVQSCNNKTCVNPAHLRLKSRR